MSNILYVIGTFQRPLIEGEAVLEAKMLVAVGRLRHEDEDCEYLESMGLVPANFCLIF